MSRENLSQRWADLSQKLEAMFDMEINEESILFLIGIRELGSNGQREFSKQEKTDLMHIAVCRLFSASGYYQLSHTDQDGWPHWELLVPLPNMDTFTQAYTLKLHILNYFDEVFEE